MHINSKVTLTQGKPRASTWMITHYDWLLSVKTELLHVIHLCYRPFVDNKYDLGSPFLQEWRVASVSDASRLGYSGSVEPLCSYDDRRGCPSLIDFLPRLNTYL
jgi:hypothetical protein